MNTKEILFNGKVINGFLMLFSQLIIIPAIITMAWFFTFPGLALATSIILFIFWCIIWAGFSMVEPNEALCILFFGKYKGTFRQTGYFWMNPFLTTKKLSLRARNLNADPIKVNDKTGNPILIGLVLVWRLKDTYKAMFEIDAETMSSSAPNANIGGASVAQRMNAFESFVKIQSDAALRQVAGQYAYDNDDNENKELTLRDGSEEINEQLVLKLNERLAMSGMEVVEARINYLAYAPEIAAVMLRRQQASAVISAREKIVEGAVSMVNLALNKLKEEQIVDLDEEKKAAMVSNLLVVLCADEAAQPVVNTGTLYQ
ncbi:MAG: SPFH domain-containing protein [Parabacteroides distasonis]|nr:SPFH domain-containing protein [Parabacteroides distasonis]MBQ4161402.1 SPFH domain-containing protein [Parabacteroides sp.]